MTPASPEMKCLLWNVEWAPPRSVRGDLILGGIRESAADVVCLTETERDFLPAGHLVSADADYGYSHSGGRRKVVLWSRQPWSDVDVMGDESMPGGRFVSGVTVATAGIGDAESHKLIDHIATTSGLTVTIDRLLPRTGGDGTRLTDHTGILATLLPVPSAKAGAPLSHHPSHV